jgi:hypothetical protein
MKAAVRELLDLSRKAKGAYYWDRWCNGDFSPVDVANVWTTELT